MSVSVYDPPVGVDDERVCRRCARAAFRVPWFPILNARTGRYHSGGEDGLTDCGLDATGPHWLWPL